MQPTLSSERSADVPDCVSTVRLVPSALCIFATSTFALYSKRASGLLSPRTWFSSSSMDRDRCGSAGWRLRRYIADRSPDTMDSASISLNLVHFLPQHMTKSRYRPMMAFSKRTYIPRGKLSGRNRCGLTKSSELTGTYKCTVSMARSELEVSGLSTSLYVLHCSYHHNPLRSSLIFS